MSDALTLKQLAARIDLHLHRGDATAKDIEQQCALAHEKKFASVSVNSSRIVLARHFLDDTKVLVSAVVGFPLGAMEADAKRYETEAAIDAGAQEIEMVLNIGRLKDGDTKFVLREVRDVVEAADERPVKVILETSLLSNEEKWLACELITDTGARFVQSSTGFSSGGATIEDVRLLREAVGPKFGVKASGGIRDLKTILALIEAGATRIGTSNVTGIVEEFGPVEVEVEKN